jgi:polysaccharide export outer membrane protein
VSNEILNKKPDYKITDVKLYCMYVKNVNRLKRLLVCITLLSIGSCATKKQILYLQDIDAYNNTKVVIPENTIQQNDILSVIVSSSIAETAEPYNKGIQNSGGSGGVQNQSVQMQGYLVSKDLAIKLPILGNIVVANKTLKELELRIENLLMEGEHLNDPTVIITLLNAKFTTLGDIGSGTYYFTENSLTILQAIGMAGDLSLSGLRDDIVLIREIDGERTVAHIDLTAANLFDSPYYFIKPNDVIYVKPNTVRIKSAGFITGPTALIGFGTLLITTILLFTR